MRQWVDTIVPLDWTVMSEWSIQEYHWTNTNTEFVLFAFYSFSLYFFFYISPFGWCSSETITHFNWTRQTRPNNLDCICLACSCLCVCGSVCVWVCASLFVFINFPFPCDSRVVMLFDLSFTLFCLYPCLYACLFALRNGFSHITHTYELLIIDTYTHLFEKCPKMFPTGVHCHCPMDHILIYSYINWHTGAPSMIHHLPLVFFIWHITNITNTIASS